MTEYRRQSLRNIMLMAWDFFRSSKRSGENRLFSDCLSGAWKLSKGLAREAAKLRGIKYLRLSHSLIRSPISRAFAGNPVAESAHAYLTSVLGR